MATLDAGRPAMNERVLMTSLHRVPVLRLPWVNLKTSECESEFPDVPVKAKGESGVVESRCPGRVRVTRNILELPEEVPIKYLARGSPEDTGTTTIMSRKPMLSKQRPDDKDDMTEVEAVKQRRLLESQDSSYDSDYENSDCLSPRTEEASQKVGYYHRGQREAGASGQAHTEHSDVSRTVSDTLGAEFAEYVTQPPDFDKIPTLLEHVKYQPVLKISTSPDEELGGVDLDKFLADPSYTSRVEFGLRLGYTELQVQMALSKLGSQAAQNELLAELIRLGTKGVKGQGGTDHHHHHPGEAAGAQTAYRTESLEGTDSFSLELRRNLPEDRESVLRHIVIDGSNVAMSHGNKEVFSCRGILLCVDWFRARGHQEVTVFVPKWRKEASRPDAPIKDQEILLQLEKERLLVFTPSRHVGGRRLICYDDRYILRLAAEVDGIVVSNDNYRDLLNEAPEFKKVVEERLLMYSFVNDRFMPPDDPLGRHGPSLDNFLRTQPKLPDSLPPHCPYGKKCTYGNKCKYYHPERGSLPQKSVTERLAEQAKIQLQEVKARGAQQGEKMKGLLPLQVTTSCDLSSELSSKPKKAPLSRTRSLVNPLSVYTPPETASQGQFAEPGDLGSQCSNWANMSLKLPHNIPGPRAELFLEPDSGGHLSVAKRLSDPDNGLSKASKQQSQSFSGRGKPLPSNYNSPGSSGTTAEDANQNQRNLHRKLQRQLTLNPSYDPRLYQMHGYVGGPDPGTYHAMEQPSPSGPQQGLLQQPSQQQATQKPHTPLSRILSDSRAMSAGGGGPGPGTHHLGIWDNKLALQHPHVTRIASAPDSTRHWSSASPSPARSPVERMKRLSSTSDTRLNLSSPHPGPGPNVGGSVQGLQSQFSRQYMGAAVNYQPWLHPTMFSPTGQSPYLQENLLGMVVGSGHTHLIPHLGQPVRPSSVPPPGSVQGGSGSPSSSSPLATPRALSPDLHQENTRRKILFRLSSIFPEEQVQLVMDKYPEETDPQRLCAAILATFPKESNQ